MSQDPQKVHRPPESRLLRSRQRSFHEATSVHLIPPHFTSSLNQHDCMFSRQQNARTPDPAHHINPLYVATAIMRRRGKSSKIGFDQFLEIREFEKDLWRHATVILTMRFLTVWFVILSSGNADSCRQSSAALRDQSFSLLLRNVLLRDSKYRRWQFAELAERIINWLQLFVSFLFLGCRFFPT
jgi:hypothetical protein